MVRVSPTISTQEHAMQIEMDRFDTSSADLDDFGLQILWGSPECCLGHFHPLLNLTGFLHRENRVWGLSACLAFSHVDRYQHLLEVEPFQVLRIRHRILKHELIEESTSENLVCQDPVVTDMTFRLVAVGSDQIIRPIRAESGHVIQHLDRSGALKHHCSSGSIQEPHQFCQHLVEVVSLVCPLSVSCEAWQQASSFERRTDTDTETLAGC